MVVPKVRLMLRWNSGRRTQIASDAGVSGARTDIANLLVESVHLLSCCRHNIYLQNYKYQLIDYPTRSTTARPSLGFSPLPSSH